MKNGKNKFWVSPPPKKIFAGRTNFFGQKRKKSKLFKIAWNGEKISQKRVLDFLAPPQKKLEGVQKIFVENEKNQSYSKFAEMAIKLVEKGFWTF